MKKLTFILITLISFESHAQDVTSGYCGPKDANGNFSSSCFYTYDDTTKTLIISGEGKMADVESPWTMSVPRTYMPWRLLDYQNVIINEGITSISNNAFTDSRIINASLPESLSSIGEGAFHQTPLENINLPKNITQIGDFALSLNKLSSVILPEGLTELTERVLYGNKLMTSVVIPESVTFINPASFAHLDGSLGSPLSQIYCSSTLIDQCETALSYRNNDVSIIEYDTIDGVYALDGVYYASAQDMKKGYEGEEGHSCGTDIDICKAEVLKNRGICEENECSALVASANNAKLLKVGSKTYQSLDALLKGDYDKRRIYTIEEANFVAGTKNRVSITYR